MEELILKLEIAIAPLVTQTIKKFQETHNGAMPTDPEMEALLSENVHTYLAEGSAWKAAHPNV